MQSVRDGLGEELLIPEASPFIRKIVKKKCGSKSAAVLAPHPIYDLNPRSVGVAAASVLKGGMN